ncbi:SdiA-regulated domain-containing protein [Labilibacter marinus]|uniref:SdiA-regulated domain-containing protein n=1 Tax=Labilibacter marinus TaxID=1477105 RepID=UPI00117BC1A9|nr:SdiA-regulated domain-containing protein [Labilibacter marinus]
MKLFIYLIIFISINVTFNSCFKQNTVYSFNQPSEVFKLSSELNEISGLQAISDSVILAVQDEDGYIFYIDAHTGEIINKKKFGKKGDYEGITFYKQSIYVLKSNGTIYRIKNKKSKIYSFGKKGNFDFEGLCTDDKNDRLLLACKKHGNKNKLDHIYIYGFSLSDKHFIDSPVFKIEKKDAYKKFQPSAIAIHPKGNIFVLSSTAKMLLELSPQGKVINHQHLSPFIFNQPEGITFLSNGDMFISNEKKKAYPTLLRFNRN